MTLARLGPLRNLNHAGHILASSSLINVTAAYVLHAFHLPHRNPVPWG